MQGEQKVEKEKRKKSHSVEHRKNKVLYLPPQKRSESFFLHVQ